LIFKQFLPGSWKNIGAFGMILVEKIRPKANSPNQQVKNYENLKY